MDSRLKMSGMTDGIENIGNDSGEIVCPRMGRGRFRSPAGGL